MHNFRTADSLSMQIAFVLILSVLFWATGMPTFFRSAKAAQLTSLSDTLADSDLGVVSSSTIQFTATNGIAALETIKITWDPTGSLFSEVGSTATTSEMYFKVGATDYNVVNSCTAGDEVTAAADYNNGTDESLTFTLCAAATPISAASVVQIGIGNLITNPAGAGSYVVRIGGTMTNSGDARVAIIDDVVVTASVDTSLTFTINGMATTTTVNGTTTTIGTTATLIPFSAGGALQPNTPVVGSQRLNVSTNAGSGFSVTVTAGRGSSGTTLANGGALTSSNGDDIDFFKDNNRTGTPSAWTAPVNTLAAGENSYGHWGLTTSDNDNVNFSAFGSDNWVGDFWATSTGRVVFSNDGPADGSTANVGSTTVGYAIQIGSLQQAGNDYTTTLTYVATPVF